MFNATTRSYEGVWCVCEMVNDFLESYAFLWVNRRELRKSHVFVFFSYLRFYCKYTGKSNAFRRLQNRFQVHSKEPEEGAHSFLSSRPPETSQHALVRGSINLCDV